MAGARVDRKAQNLILRELYEFEKTLLERLEAEREIVADVMGASDVEADAMEIEIEGRAHRRVGRRNRPRGLKEP